MFQRTFTAWGLLLMLLPAPSFAADIHSVFTSWSSWYGRERTSKAEIWIGADRECHIKAHEIRIVRKDLGLMWRMRPNSKTYNEYPLKAEEAPSKAGEKTGKEQPPAPAKEEKEDLRFIGRFEDPVYEWNIKLMGDDTVKGQACRVYSIRGEADFAEIDLKIWVSPDGKDKGLAAPDELIQAILNREQIAVESLSKVLAEYPNGGIVQIEKRSDPPIGPESKGKVALDVYETTAPPAGIYDPPAGARKEGGKAS